VIRKVIEYRDFGPGGNVNNHLAPVSGSNANQGGFSRNNVAWGLGDIDHFHNQIDGGGVARRVRWARVGFDFFRQWYPAR